MVIVDEKECCHGRWSGFWDGFGVVAVDDKDLLPWLRLIDRCNLQSSAADLAWPVFLTSLLGVL